MERHFLNDNHRDIKLEPKQIEFEKCQDLGHLSRFRDEQVIRNYRIIAEKHENVDPEVNIRYKESNIESNCVKTPPYDPKPPRKPNSHRLLTTVTCSICPYLTTKKSLLKKHMVVHKNYLEEYRHACHLCPFKTKHKKSLKKHMLIHRSTDELPTFENRLRSLQTEFKTNKECFSEDNDDYETPVFKCAICSHETSTKYNLKQHMLLHRSTSELTFFKCESCSYKSRYKAALTKHKLSHKDVSEVELYRCKLCWRKSKHKCDIEKHMLVHREALDQAVARLSKKRLIDSSQ